jgi:hypothetical protein
MKSVLVRFPWLLGLAAIVLIPMALVLSSGLISPVAGQKSTKKAKVPKYVGAVACAKMCHKTAKKGEQLRIWQESAHAKAYETLATPEAKAVGKKQGIEDPQESDAWLACHTTAHGAPDELKGRKFSHAEGVGCESCHGPGSLYKKLKVMKDREQAIANGLIIPDASTCTQCHNEKSPTYKPFDYEERWKEITHPKPTPEG